MCSEHFGKTNIRKKDHGKTSTTILKASRQEHRSGGLYSNGKNSLQKIQMESCQPIKRLKKKKKKKKKKEEEEKKNHTDSRKTTIQNVRRMKILIRCCVLLWVVRCLNTKSASFVYQRETWFLSLIYIVANNASYHSSTHIHVTVLALPDEEFIVSSKPAP